MRKLIGIALCALVVLMVGTCSCSVNSHTQKDTNKVKTETDTDKSDSVKMLLTENSRLEAENKALQYGGIYFNDNAGHDIDTSLNKTTPCPNVINTVEITADGIKGSGNIKSAYFAKSTLEKIVMAQNKTIDSLRSVKQKEKVLKETVTITKTKHTKASFLNFWWLLAIGFALGKWGGKIFNFVKSKII